MKGLKQSIRKYTHPFSEWTRTHILQNRKIGLFGMVLIISVFVYAISFSYFTIFKHNVFRSFGWDLGIFDQSLYTTVFSGRFLYYTAELYMVPSGVYFASHFSPILFLLIPFYVIRPSAETLLVLQASALAAGAFPLYLTSKKILGDGKTAMIISLLYLLYPALQAGNWFDFHTEAFLPLFLFSAYYFMQTERWKLYALSIVLALAIEEHVCIVVALMALYFLVVSKPKTLLEPLKNRQLNQFSTSAVTLIVSVVWFFLAQSIKGSFYISPQFVTRYEATSAFGILGTGANPLLLPFYIVSNPQNAWNALLFDYPTKLFFLIILFGPLIFLSLKSKFSLIPLALLVPSLVSNYLAYYTIGAQYPLFVVPLIFIALIISLKQFDIRFRFPILKIAFVVSLLFIISLSPISPLSGVFANKGLVWYPSLPSPNSADVESLLKLVNLIPPQASVLTQNHIFPHVSARLNAYVVPPIGYFENSSNYLDELLSKSDYVLLDLWAWDDGTATVFDKVTEGSTYGIYGLGSNSILFKRNYHGQISYGYYMDDRFFQPYKDLLVNKGQATFDASSRSGTVVLCLKGSEGIVVYGPYTYLIPGEYNITFLVKVGEHDEGYIGTLSVVDDSSQTLSRKDVYGFGLKSGLWTNFTLQLSSTILEREIQFQVYSSGVSDIYIDGVRVEKTSDTAETNFGSITFNSNQLLLDERYEIADGFFVHLQNLTSDFFWWGPYISLPQNDYRVTFFLKFTPFSTRADEKLLSLDISADGGRKILATYDIYGSGLTNSVEGSPDWYKVAMGFSANSSLENVEFRGMSPSPGYNIYLAFVLIEKVG